jgi:HAD superfamily hydrolase (TIGR01509 family)
LTAEHKLELVGRPTDELAGIIGRHLGTVLEPGAFAADLDGLIREHLERGIEVMAGAGELLAELRAVGVPVALVSNSPLHFVRRAIELAGLADRFEVIVSGHEVRAPKPAPDAYLEAASRLGVEPGPQVIVLEDSPTGVDAGRAAGMTVLGVPSVPGVTLEGADQVFASLTDRGLRSRLGLCD